MDTVASAAALTAKTLTVNDLIDAYLADRRNPMAERPCRHPRSLETALVPVRREWGHMTVAEFGDGSKQRVKRKCLEWRSAEVNPVTQGTIRKRISTLKTVFKFAVEEEIIKRKHEPVISLPAQGPPRERVLSEEELARLLAEVESRRTPHHARLLWHLLIRCGQRRGCVLDLTWSLVDFEKRVILFRETQTASERSKKRRGNKPMDDALYQIMRDAYEARDEDCPWVIEWRGQKVKCPYGAMRALYKRAGLEGIRTHDMRRTSATIVNNETDGDMQTAANHINDTVATARKHYIVEDPKVHLPAMKAVSAVLARVGEKD